LAVAVSWGFAEALLADSYLLNSFPSPRGLMKDRKEPRGSGGLDGEWLDARSLEGGDCWLRRRVQVTRRNPKVDDDD
jgi:hypothetical protein